VLGKSVTRRDSRIKEIQIVARQILPWDMLCQLPGFKCAVLANKGATRPPECRYNLAEADGMASIDPHYLVPEGERDRVSCRWRVIEEVNSYPRILVTHTHQFIM
jgi:hypothetical protein